LDGLGTNLNYLIFNKKGKLVAQNLSFDNDYFGGLGMTDPFINDFAFFLNYQQKKSDAYKIYKSGYALDTC
jgi:hypothetical protein